MSNNNQPQQLAVEGVPIVTREQQMARTLKRVEALAEQYRLELERVLGGRVHLTVNYWPTDEDRPVIDQACQTIEAKRNCVEGESIHWYEFGTWACTLVAFVKTLSSESGV